MPFSGSHRRSILMVFAVLVLGACSYGPRGMELAPDRVLADAGYMQECRDLNAEISELPVQYRGLLPGTSTQDDVAATLGTPRQVYAASGAHGQRWNYEGVSIVFAEDRVRMIVVTETVGALDLNAHVLKYGCPDLILPIPEGDENLEGSLEFIYYRIGLALLFPGDRVALTQTPEGLHYSSAAETLDDYLEAAGVPPYFFGPPLPWRKAVW